jgi:hypothetical protein
VGAAALLAVTAACGSASDDGRPTSADTPTTQAPATQAPTTEAPTTGGPTTSAPTTEAAPTQPPTTTAPPAGWTVIDAATFPAPLAAPCCASNWYGVPSPPLPAAGQPLADGAYLIGFDWPDDVTEPIDAEVSRLESCNVLPRGGCEDNGGGPYAAEEMGIDRTAVHELTITLDGSLRVVLGGFTGLTDGAGNFAEATGADLAALVAAVDADYQTAILDPFAAGSTRDEIVNALRAEPAHGFGPPGVDLSGELVYTFDGAPPLLYQTLPGIDDDLAARWRGSDVIGRIALLVDDGTYTITTYAGFYS